MRGSIAPFGVGGTEHRSLWFVEPRWCNPRCRRVCTSSRLVCLCVCLPIYPDGGCSCRLNKGAPSRSSMPILDHAAGTAAEGKPALCLGRMSRSLVYQPVCGVVRTISSVELGAGDGKDAMLLVVVLQVQVRWGDRDPCQGRKSVWTCWNRDCLAGCQSGEALPPRPWESCIAQCKNTKLVTLCTVPYADCIWLVKFPKFTRPRCVEVAYKPRHINLVFERSATRS